MNAPPASARSQLTPRRLAPVVFVLGKGGVGRTTVAASLAVLEASQRGRAVLVEFGDGVSGRRALRDAHRRVTHVALDPDEVLQRGATPLFGSATIARLVLGNFAMRRLVQAAPAVREVATLESVRQVSQGHPGVRVIVDMPATGHSVALLRVARQGRDHLQSGPLWKYCDRLCREVVAPDRASVVVVTLPERLVLEETLELCDAIAAETGLSVDSLVVNRMPVAVPAAALDAARALAADAGPLAAPAVVLAAVLAARELAAREARAALAAVSLGRYPVWSLPLEPVDPCAADVARWLAAQGAA
jgi:arsenite/tail-anchored protein-transporting ATPase